MSETSDIKVSIIIPCYKVEKYLPKCLDSLLNQTFDDYELICINDGSPDSCIDILRQYEANYPERIVIIDKQNEGTWRGRKDGIRIARGEYIGFLDSDDYVEEDFLHNLYSAAIAEDADIAVCGFVREDLLTGNILSEEYVEERHSFSIEEDPGRLLELNGAPWNKIFKSAYLKEMADLTTPPPILDDMMFHMLAYIKMRDVVVFVPKPLVHYMVRGDSLINTVKVDKVESTQRAFLEVADQYHQTQNERLILLLDAMAFLHFGVSLMFRLLNDRECDVKAVLANNTQFLDEYFPTWRNSPYLSRAYVFSHGTAFKKLKIARSFYKRGLMAPFLSMYSWLINTTGIDIKW